MILSRSAIIFLIILTAFCSCKSTDSVKRITPDQKFSDDELLQDIEFVFQTIQKVHPNFYESSELVNSFRLPNSRLILDVSSMKFELRPERTEHSVGVLPHVIVQKNIPDEIEGIDIMIRKSIKFVESNSSK